MENSINFLTPALAVATVILTGTSVHFYDKASKIPQQASASTESAAPTQAVSQLNTQPNSQSNTLAKVLEKGYLYCGVSNGLPGFSNPNAQGEWEGLDVEYCQAVAAAVLGDKSKVKYVPLTTKARFSALQLGVVDILSRNTTWTLYRDTALGVNFAGVNYYDGQGFMVNTELGITSVEELNDASICVQSGTTSELNLADYFKNKGMSYNPAVFDTIKQAAKGFDSDGCDAFTTDQSALYALRLNLSNPNLAVILPEIISKEPLGPVVRQDDDAWFNIAKWTLNVMINAEEYGITSVNVDSMRQSNEPNVRRILGLDGPKGKGLGIRDDWGYQIIKQVGNYSESFERTVGKDSPLKIARGVNALWNQGGFMYAAPIR
jgi:general L-amino acid transport system substrate-binding protein